MGLPHRGLLDEVNDMSVFYNVPGFVFRNFTSNKMKIYET
jgi:hypothetical protein